MFERVTVDPDVMHGQPCIRGHRFTVAQLVRLVAAGCDVERMRDHFPFIEPDDVRDALLYAAERVESDASQLDNI